MSQSATVTNVTSTESQTYTSSMLSRFAWTPDPLGDNGFLHVEFQEGGQYVYFDVPEEIHMGLQNRSMCPEDFNESVGEYFRENVRNEFNRKNEDYLSM